LNRTQRQYLIYLGAIVAALVVISALVVPALALSTRNLILTVIVALVIAALATIGVFLIAARLLNASRQISRITEEIGKLEGEASARHLLTESARQHVTAAVEKLNALNTPIPASVGAAQARRVELAGTL